MARDVQPVDQLSELCIDVGATPERIRKTAPFMRTLRVTQDALAVLADEGVSKWEDAALAVLTCVLTPGGALGLDEQNAYFLQTCFGLNQAGVSFTQRMESLRNHERFEFATAYKTLVKRRNELLRRVVVGLASLDRYPCAQLDDELAPMDTPGITVSLDSQRSRLRAVPEWFDKEYVPGGDAGLEKHVGSKLILDDPAGLKRLAKFAGKDPVLISMLAGVINHHLELSADEVEQAIKGQAKKHLGISGELARKHASVASWLLSLVSDEARTLWYSLATFGSGAFEFDLLTEVFGAKAMPAIVELLDLGLVDEPAPEHVGVWLDLADVSTQSSVGSRLLAANQSEELNHYVERLSMLFFERLRTVADSLILARLGASRIRRIQAGYSDDQVPAMPSAAALSWVKAEERNIMVIMQLSPVDIRDAMMLQWLRAMAALQADGPDDLVRKLVQEQRIYTHVEREF